MQYPTTYPQYGFQYPQQVQMPVQQPIQQPVQQPSQIQSGGFMVIPSEDMVQTFPVEPGKCVTFKVEGKPIVLEKSKGFSQFEAPRIERYRLVKEEAEEKPVSEYETLLSRLDNLEGEIDGLKKKLSNNYRKKENIDDTKSHNADDK